MEKEVLQLLQQGDSSGGEEGWKKVEERTGAASGNLEVEEREFERILVFWLCFHL